MRKISSERPWLIENHSATQIISIRSQFITKNRAIILQKIKGTLKICNFSPDRLWLVVNSLNVVMQESYPSLFLLFILRNSSFFSFLAEKQAE